MTITIYSGGNSLSLGREVNARSPIFAPVSTSLLAPLLKDASAVAMIEADGSNT